MKFSSSVICVCTCADAYPGYIRTKAGVHNQYYNAHQVHTLEALTWSLLLIKANNSIKILLQTCALRLNTLTLCIASVKCWTLTLMHRHSSQIYVAYIKQCRTMDYGSIRKWRKKQILTFICFYFNTSKYILVLMNSFIRAFLLI